MSDRFRVPGPLAQRLKELKLSLPAVLASAGLPAGFFQQEKILVSTDELFALWRAIGECSGDPAIGLKLGTESRIERYDPTAIAALCSQSFGDALHRMARYKQLTCPEEIRLTRANEERAVGVPLAPGPRGRTGGARRSLLVLDSFDWSARRRRAHVPLAGGADTPIDPSRVD